MSASNWAICPRCKKRAETARAKAIDDAAALYGNATKAEYEAACAAIPEIPEIPARFPHEFREDYEIYGAETGTVKVYYGGSCENCGLSLNFEHEHQIPGVDA